MDAVYAAANTANETVSGFKWGWDAIAAIGQVLGAAATFWAVMVSLKLARENSQSNVKVITQIGFPVFGQSTGDTTVYFTAVNVGPIPVKLDTAGVLLPNKMQIIFPFDYGDAIPIKLDISEKTSFGVKVNNLTAQLIEQGYRGKVKLRPFFGDATGKRYFEDWEFDIDGWM